MSDARRIRILLAVSAAAFLGPFTQTVYAPSLVEIGTELRASMLMVNLTISVYSIVFAVGSFVWGPLAVLPTGVCLPLRGLFRVVSGGLARGPTDPGERRLCGDEIRTADVAEGSIVREI